MSASGAAEKGMELPPVPFGLSSVTGTPTARFNRGLAKAILYNFIPRIASISRAPSLDTISTILN